jgi:hypothetical protein
VRKARHFLICCLVVTGILLDTGTGCLKSVVRYLPKRISR